ncbi:hypothetical protein [Terrimonas pollutisoli]|uniref:hypothetical protein n=1 Tax=Terrimonas pollutisoli TaxID=3034147 RepID=UPI0023ED0D77|nr:hypothetical protein [Terrimonas sp. H1YJ31]
MKQYIKQNVVTALSFLLALPTAYFIVISVLKYEMGINSPFDSVAPFLERMGIKETPGWNINLLILFGPVVALGLTLLQVLKVKWSITNEEFHFHFAVKKRWFPLLVIAFSLSLLAVLTLYMIGENCR